MDLTREETIRDLMRATVDELNKEFLLKNPYTLTERPADLGSTDELPRHHGTTFSVSKDHAELFGVTLWRNGNGRMVSIWSMPFSYDKDRLAIERKLMDLGFEIVRNT